MLGFSARSVSLWVKFSWVGGNHTAFAYGDGGGTADRFQLRFQPSGLTGVSRAEYGDGNVQATVVFQQTESSSARTRVYTYEAVLRERSSTGEWQILENRIIKRN